MKAINNLSLDYTSLFFECDFSLRNGPSRTNSTVKGVSEKKIVPQGQEAGRVFGSAKKQTGWEV